ncbi:MAG: sigma-70 family RNA polymerase sigma factor [Balneolaceae bacterium]|nr:sigma-70 family RNA polymerase sigma factor [Balneolaceae bacterium]
MTASKEEEFELVQKVLDGQQELYQKLVDRYAPMIFHIVRQFEKDEDEVEELAQQIFVKCYERLGSFKMNSRFSSWLYMIAKNHCRDYAKNIRRQNKRFSEMEEETLNSRMSSTERPDELMEQQEWNRMLQQALNALAPGYSQAFLYKYRDNMSYQAIAKRMDLSVSALKVRVHRARKEMKEYIEKQSRI